MRWIFGLLVGTGLLLSLQSPARAAQLGGATVEAIHAREYPANRKNYDEYNSKGVDRKTVEKSSWCSHLDDVVSKPH